MWNIPAPITNSEFIPDGVGMWKGIAEHLLYGRFCSIFLG